MEAGRGDNVGGVWEIQPGADTWIAESIAVAAAHPLGVGDAMYRHAKHAAEVDTVPFGSFKRELIERVGRFDESLLTNEDYEFNARIRKSNGRIWLDPSIRSVYFARSTLQELARQYWRYGYWKLRMLRRYPDTLRWRQALPPLFVLILLGLAVVSMFFSFRDGGIVEAFNVGFEAQVWNLYCVPRWGWPPLHPDQERCCMAKARANALPGGLGDMCDVLDLVNKKDPTGDKLIRKLTVPKNPGGYYKPIEPVAPPARSMPHRPRQRTFEELTTRHIPAPPKMGVNPRTGEYFDDDIPF